MQDKLVPSSMPPLLSLYIRHRGWKHQWRAKKFVAKEIIMVVWFLMKQQRKRNYQCRNSKIICPQIFPPVKQLFSKVFAYINFGMRVIFLQLKHVFWHACNTILKFLIQHISFTHWPWMMPAPWNHNNELTNIAIKLKFDYNSYFSAWKKSTRAAHYWCLHQTVNLILYVTAFLCYCVHLS